MPTLKLVVFLGPYELAPTAAERLEFERQGVRIIGDGVHPIDFDAELKTLVDGKEIGPDTNFYIHTHGTIHEGMHVTQFGTSQSAEPTEPGIPSIPKVMVSAVLVAKLQDTVIAYQRYGLSYQKEVPWEGAIIFASCYNGQIPIDLLKLGIVLNRMLLLNAEADIKSFGRVDTRDISGLLRNSGNLYKFVAEESRSGDAWTVLSPNVPLFKTELPRNVQDIDGRAANRALLEFKNSVLQKLWAGNLLPEAKADLQSALAKVELVQNTFVPIKLGSPEWWVWAGRLNYQYATRRKPVDGRPVYMDPAVEFHQSLADYLQSNPPSFDNLLTLILQGRIPTADLVFPFISKMTLSGPQVDELLGLILKQKPTYFGEYKNVFKKYLEFVLLQPGYSSDLNLRKMLSKILISGDGNMLRVVAEEYPERVADALFSQTLQGDSVVPGGESVFRWETTQVSAKRVPFSTSLFKFVPDYLVRHPSERIRVLDEISDFLLEKRTQLDFQFADLNYLNLRDRTYLLNRRVVDGKTLLDHAIESDKFSAAECLMSMGANIRASGASAYQTLLGKSQAGNADATKLYLMVDAGGSPYALTSLIGSSRFSREALIELLERQPPDYFYLTDSNSNNVLAAAINMKEWTVVTLALSRMDAPRTMQLHAADRAFHMALGQGDVELAIRMLNKFGLALLTENLHVEKVAKSLQAIRPDTASERYYKEMLQAYANSPAPEWGPKETFKWLAKNLLGFAKNLNVDGVSVFQQALLDFWKKTPAWEGREAQQLAVAFEAALM